MHAILGMGYNDVLKYLKDRYDIRIDSETLRKPLKYMSEKRNPKDEECFRVCESFSSRQEENSRHRVLFATKGDNNRHFTAWDLEEWIQDYETYVFIPGVSIEFKPITNRFRYLLFSIDVRTHSGQVHIFFMDFVPSETQWSFRWMLQKFVSVVQVSPGMVLVDQDAAVMAELQKIMPNSFLTLDERHLNKNQLENVAEWCSSIYRPTWNKEMNNDLHSIRRSKTFEELNERRNVFKSKYFLAFDCTLQRWYSFLYCQNLSLLRRLQKPMRFLYQGTGYSESARLMFCN